MPGRTFVSATGYRYGFNGKEKTDEVSGSGNNYDYGFRIYNPRLGKFLSVDPLMQSYPWYTPYQFAGNSPIAFIDIDGKEEGASSTVSTMTKTSPELVQTSKELTKQLAKQAAETAASTEGGKALTKMTVQQVGQGAGSTFLGNALGVLFFMLEPANSDYKGAGAVSQSEMQSYEKKLDVKPIVNSTDEPAPLQRIASDPSELTNEELKASEQRIKAGEATLQDYHYQNEIAKRKKEGTYNTTKPEPYDSNAPPPGFHETKEFGKPHGQKVYKNGNQYISKDIDGHNGGVWKLFEKSGGKLKRIATVDKDLKPIKK